MSQMKNAETADQCKYIHDMGWPRAVTGMPGYIYACMAGFYRMGFAEDSMALGRHIIHSLAAHYNLKRPLSAHYS